MWWRKLYVKLPIFKFNWKSRWLEGLPQRKGVCAAVRVQTPFKPNSGLKKVARVKLIHGKTVMCKIPGEGHNLQTHSVVTVEGGPTKDLRTVFTKVVRGSLDCLPVKGRRQKLTKFGCKKFVEADIRTRRIYQDRLISPDDAARELFRTQRILSYDDKRPPLVRPPSYDELVVESKMNKPIFYDSRPYAKQAPFRDEGERVRYSIEQDEGWDSYLAARERRLKAVESDASLPEATRQRAAAVVARMRA